MNVRLGDAVAVDKPLCTLYVNDETNLHAAIEHIQKAVTISAQRPTPIPMVYDVIRDEAI
jgi:thymidine phosphorylase